VLSQTAENSPRWEPDRMIFITLPATALETCGLGARARLEKNQLEKNQLAKWLLVT
jgi:hypothetical protein